MKNTGLPWIRVRARRGAKRATAAWPAQESFLKKRPHSSSTMAVLGWPPGVEGEVHSMARLSSSGEKRRKNGAPGSSPESNSGELSVVP